LQYVWHTSSKGEDVERSLHAFLALPASCKDHRWLHVVLRLLLWSHAAEAMLADIGFGWCDGSCHTCAQGIQEYLLESRLLHPEAVNLAVIVDSYVSAQHVVVCVHHRGQRWFLDADGVHSEEHLLSYWSADVRVHLPRIDEDYDPDWLDEEIPFNSRISAQVTELLRHTLGPFSPSWLESRKNAVLNG
jgi:hypothetical protein